MSVVSQPPPSVYPSIPEGCETGLLLFGAAFNGENDGAHLLAAGLRCDVVDNRADRLAAMQADYPPEWRFIERDAFEYVEQAIATKRRWDVVSVDPFTNQAERVRSMLSDFEQLAERLLVVGVLNERIDKRWRSWKVYQRSQLWSWLAKEL